MCSNVTARLDEKVPAIIWLVTEETLRPTMPRGKAERLIQVEVEPESNKQSKGNGRAWD